LASSSAWSARFKQGVSGSSPEREVAAPNVTLTSIRVVAFAGCGAALDPSDTSTGRRNPQANRPPAYHSSRNRSSRCEPQRPVVGPTRRVAAARTRAQS